MALKQSEAQFQRSGPATPDPSPKKRVVVDGELERGWTAGAREFGEFDQQGGR